jgi:exonuclease III
MRGPNSRRQTWSAFRTYWGDRYETDHGLDHLLLSKVVASRFVEAGMDGDVRDEDNASDHAPAWIHYNSEGSSGLR